MSTYHIVLRDTELAETSYRAICRWRFCVAGFSFGLEIPMSIYGRPCRLFSHSIPFWTLQIQRLIRQQLAPLQASITSWGYP